MATYIEISDDDDSFSGPGCSKTDQTDHLGNAVSLISDEELQNISIDNTLLSDDEELPNVIIKKNTAIKSLFPSKNKKRSVTKREQKTSTIKSFFPQKQNVKVPVAKVTRPPIEPPKAVFNRMIAGVNVLLPVDPYGSQVALMAKVIITKTLHQIFFLKTVS